MSKRIAVTASTFAVAGTLAFGVAGAGAAHCTDAGGPGNSDYSTHVRATNGSGAHAEGQHKGYSTCNERSANFQS